MATTKHIILGTEIISTDWANFCASTAQDEYFPLHMTRNIQEQINNHPAAPLISIHFMFSFLYKKNKAAYPDAPTLHQRVNAMVDLYSFINNLPQYTPSDIYGPPHLVMEESTSIQ